MMRQRPPHRRSFVLIAVLVIVTAGLFVVTGLLFSAQGENMAAAVSADMAQNRALAWSGLQAVMSRLNDQRDRILQGEPPRLDSQYTIYETSTRLGVVRVLPTKSNASDVAENLLSCEAGKLDLNSVDALALQNTGVIDPAVATAIIDYRNQSGVPFQSVGDLLNVPNGMISAELLYGPIEKITPSNDAQFNSADLAERVSARLDGQAVEGLADVATAFSVEPSLQMNGSLRININSPWSESLSQRVADRLGQEAADQLKGMMERGVKFESEAKFIQLLRQSGLSPEDWPEIVDAFAADDEMYHFGRLDINSAPYEALLSLPGVTAEQANQLVRVRQELSPLERATIVWPVIAQIITPEQLERLAGKITTRCWTYRVRIAAGEIDGEEPEGPLPNPVIYEAVIDLSMPAPRVAYLRDISLLQIAAQTAANASLNQSQSERDSQVELQPLEPAATQSAIEGSESDVEGDLTGATSRPGSATQPLSDAPSRRIGRWR